MNISLPPWPYDLYSTPSQIVAAASVAGSAVAPDFAACDLTPDLALE